MDPTANTIYTAGNAGNGANPEPQGVVTGVGSQILAPSTQSESAQSPGAPTPLGNFNVTQLGDTADKSAKDDNFRGLTTNNNVLYFTKGSGSNGVDTVYFLDTTAALPNGIRRALDERHLARRLDLHVAGLLHQQHWARPRRRIPALRRRTCAS